MNATQVLKKILANLAMVKEEVEFTYAKLADGTILESPTFDVGEQVDVVSEDGTKAPAPDGEHEVVLKDSEGKEERIKVITKDGKIVERENVELPESEDGGDKEVEINLESIAGGDMGDDEEVATDETANPIPEDSDKEDMAKMIEKMQYRIEELERKYNEMADVKDISEGKKAEKVKAEPIPGDPTAVNTVENMAAVDPSEDEEELPKLDGAPIDENAQKIQNGVKLGKTSKLANYQSSVLSKLYK